MSIKAMKMALQYIEANAETKDEHEIATGLRQAIAEAEKQEPVAWLKVNEDSWTISLDAEPDHIPLYTTPQPKQEQGEPVAWMDSDWHYQLHKKGMVVIHKDEGDVLIGKPKPLYTHPQQRTWVGLTDEEAQKTFAKHNCTISADLAGILARAIEAKLKEKNA